RRFVRAVLAPHHREDTQLGVRRRAPEDVVNALEFVGGQAVLLGELRRDLRFGFLHAPTRAGAPRTEASADSNSRRPSSPPSPSSASQARSGCGMRPITLPL